MQKQEKENIAPEMTEAEIERLKRDIYRPTWKNSDFSHNVAQKCGFEKGDYKA